MQEKIEFELHLCLVSTESWVVSPKHLALWNGGTYMYIVHIAEISMSVYVRTVLPNLSTYTFCHSAHACS